jgi:hypothetical protein
MLFPGNALKKLFFFSNYKLPYLLITLRLLKVIYSKSDFKEKLIAQVSKKL